MATDGDRRAHPAPGTMIATELHALLGAADVSGPFVLVDHSNGSRGSPAPGPGRGDRSGAGVGGRLNSSERTSEP
jgi:hypothetical protein